jgi:hypothetical protein
MLRLRFLHLTGDRIGEDFLRPARNLRPQLHDCGIHVVDDDSFDVAWGHQRCDISHGRPHIMHELRDSAAILGRARRLVSSPAVTLLVKSQTYRNFADHNANHFEQTLHGTRCYRSASVAERPATSPAPLQPLLPPEIAGKIRLGWNWLFFPGMADLIQSEFGPERTYDVSFAGTLSYGRWHVAWHRRKLWEALPSLPGHNSFHNHRAFSRPEYHRRLARSRVAISPWGYGETCIRDVEALLAGCILIKPATPWVDTWPQYHQFPNSLFCRPDFSDLRERTIEALDQWPSLKDACRQSADHLRSQRTPENLANRIATLVREALEPPATVGNALRGVPSAHLHGP